MKKHLLLLTLIVFLLSCKQEKKHVAEELPSQWKTFLDNLEAQDKVAFKNASDETIRCYDCLENTPAEAQKMNILRETDSLWYDKIYEDLIYIPIDSFIANDYDSFFNPKFVQILKANDTSFHNTVENNVRTVAVLVTTTPPTLDFEGGQHVFSFIQAADGQWKLNEISTIP